MRSLRLLSPLVFFVLSACGPDKAVTEYEAVVDQYCACKDNACTQQVLVKIKEFGAKHQDKQRESLSKADRKRIDAASARMVGCMTARSTEGSGNGEPRP